MTRSMSFRMYCGSSLVPIGIVRDATAFVGFDAVLVDDPIEGGAVAHRGGREQAPLLQRMLENCVDTLKTRSIRSECCCR